MSDVKRPGIIPYLLVTLLLGCSDGKTPTDSPPPAEVDIGPEVPEIATCPPGSAPSPEALIPSTTPDHVRVYIDGSGSMRGFAAGQDRYQALLNALRPALLELSIFENQTFLVGKDIEPVAKGGNFGDYTAPSYYTRGETNLAAVLEAEIESGAGSSSMTLVLTDGVMSLQGGAETSTSLVDCERGSDIHCLTFKLSQLLERGTGFWILGIRSRFLGPLISELKRPGGESLGNVDLPDRPFYLWVLTDHPAAGRELIAGLLRRIGQQPDRGTLFALEVSPGEILWRVPSSDEPTSSRQLFPDPVRQGAVPGQFHPDPAGGPAILETSSKNVKGTGFGVELQLEETILSSSRGSMDHLWVFEDRFCLRWADASPRIPYRALAAKQDGELQFAFLTSSFRDLSSHRVTLHHLYARTDQANAVLPALAGWSTNDDRTQEAGSKTLNFEEFLYTLRARFDQPVQYDQPLLTLEFK